MREHFGDPKQDWRSLSASPFGPARAYEARSAFLRNAYVQLHVAEWLARRSKPGVAPSQVDLAIGAGGRTRLLVFDPPHRPRGVLVFVHGLGGAADSPNTLRLANAARARGWRAASVDMRGAGGAERQPRLYTAADADELDAAFAHEAVAGVSGPRIAVGISLGGGILVRWLGLRGGSAPVDAAVALSPTAHLPSCAEALSLLKHRFYDWSFARALGRRIREVAPAFGRRPHGRLRHFTMRRLDGDFAAVVCGQPDAASYWDHASAHHHLAGVSRPLLILAACDDPFVPIAPLRAHLGSLPGVDFRAYPHGGHLSFLEWRGGGIASALPELLLDALEPLAPRP
jgi:predicted alpha/beta-fold hydrolase